MKFRRLALSALLATIALCATASPSRASVVFDFKFDGTNNATVTPPIVGTGTLTLATDPGVGIFAFASYSPTISFSFISGSTLTESDIKTPLSNILISISDLGGGLRGIRFGGSRGGPFSGSLDFVNGGSFLSFQPNFGSLYGTDSFFGSYEGITAASVVPEPATLALSSTFGVAGLIVLSRRRKATAA